MDCGGEVAVGLPCIVLQRAHEGVVERIKFGHSAFSRTSYGFVPGSWQLGYCGAR